MARPEFLTLQEMARYFRVDDKTVSRWINAGKVPGAIRTPGGRWRVPAAEVLRLARERHMPADERLTAAEVRGAAR